MYGAARARLYTKHRSRLRHLPRRDPSAIVYPSFLLGLPMVLLGPVAPVVLAYPLLLLVPLWRNRRTMPVATVYGHLMYGVGICWQLGRQVVR
jgi:apolipoprotein N-acyltransferase